MDTEAIAWAAQKLQAFAVDKSTMDNALMMDRLYAMLAATTLAQEDEPVAWVPVHPELGPLFGATSKHRILAEGGNNLELMPLYTRPADDQETLIKLVSHVHQDAGKRIERLGLKRATLEAMATVGTMRRQINMSAADSELRKAGEEAAELLNDLLKDGLIIGYLPGLAAKSVQEKLRAALEQK